MQVLFLHISDIHIKDSSDLILNRASSIRAAVQELAVECDAVFIVMTGDVAQSGETTEYKLAEGFFDELKSEIASICSLPVHEVFIPGNHDCVLPKTTLSRQLLVDYVLKNTEDPWHPKTDEVKEAVDQCLLAQNNFFDFYTIRTGRTPSSTKEKSQYDHTFTVSGRTVRFECYNSAVLSQRYEKQGELLIPLAQAKDNSDVDLVVSLFHHPYNWLVQENARAFRKEVEHRSDIIMTGHEHRSEQYDKTTLDHANMSYFEGAVLQERSNDDSGFNVLVVDFERRERKVATFEWKSDFYKETSQSEWSTLDRNAQIAKSRFENTTEFYKFLHSPGAPFTHSTKPDLCLEDLYVFPDCNERRYSQDDSDNVALRTIAGKKLPSYVVKNHYTLFLGTEACGKTALGRTLYKEFAAQDFVPIWFNGATLSTNEGDALNKNIRRAVEEQYGEQLVERYVQLDKEKKVAIIDSFHLLKGYAKHQASFLARLKDRFGYIVLLADEVIHIKELLRKKDSENTLLSFNHCELQTFGNEKRGELIEKWVRLDREDVVDEATTMHRLREADALVKTLLGKNLLPAHPIFILTILQQYEARSIPELPSGSFGYYYEFLIFDALRNSPARTQMDLVYSFTSYLAFRMFDRKSKTVSRSDFESITIEYRKLQKVQFLEADMLKNLVDSALLRMDSEGNYHFQYRYSSYYFTARYISTHLHKPAYEQNLRERIDGMIAKIYVEDYANIVMFLVYLSADERVTQALLDKSRTLFAQYDPCNLTTDVAVVRKLRAESPNYHLTEGCAATAREQHRKALEQDELAENEQPLYTYNGEEEIADEAEDEADERRIAETLTYNTAFKTLQILGQILRNFPSHLEGELKVEIAKECYSLGMRVLRSMFVMVDERLVLFQELVYGLLCEEEEPKTDDDHRKIAAKVDSVLYLILQDTTHGMLKRISTAVGSKTFGPTYEEVVDERMPIAIEMINATIKLDHFTHFPKDEVVDLYGRLEKYPFTGNILRRLVRDFLHQYGTNRIDRDSVCQKLDIKIEYAKVLNPSNKVTPKALPAPKGSTNWDKH